MVALIITVIVLLILAGISLNFALGDNGILKKAQDSKNAYQQANQVEQKTLQNIRDYMYNEKNDGGTEDNTTGGGNNSTGGGGGTETASNSTSYVGYYADSDGDGTVDGIIYADLAVGGSGTWNGDNETRYEYSPITTGLKSYTVSSTSYTGFKNQWTKPVISVKKGSTGTDRFYVMALEDINPGNGYYWYYKANGKLDNTIEDNTNDFGQGSTNTNAIVAEWNKGTSGKYGGPHKDDLWGIIQGKIVDDSGNITTDETKNYYNKGWFVPSKAEWSAFGDMAFSKMKVTETDYADYGLEDSYWSSAQRTQYAVYTAYFKRGFGIIHSNVFINNKFVRLSTTF